MVVSATDEQMVMRVEIQPQILEWARDRSGRPASYFEKNFPRLDEWVTRDAQPTLRQAEMFAKSTYTPFGYLFLVEPPEEVVPLPDFRTIRDAEHRQPSPALLDTIHSCQNRQEWYRQFALSEGDPPLDFVGSVSVDDDPREVAASIRTRLKLGLEERAGDWTNTLTALVRRVEELGILVMVNGIVGINTHRKLDPTEFRGFAIVDDRAPLIFVNGADSKSAQMFTLAHEVAHIWVGETALSDVSPERSHEHIERWCNEVAAEVLVPLAVLHDTLPDDFDGDVSELRMLSRYFRVSTLVIIRRLQDVGHWSAPEMWSAYRAEEQRLKNLKDVAAKKKKPGGGPSFYVVNAVRVGKLFARSVYTSTLEGRTTYKEAYRLLNVRKHETFKKFGQQLGFDAKWLT